MLRNVLESVNFYPSVKSQPVRFLSEMGWHSINKVCFYGLEARDQFPTGEESFCFLPESGTRQIPAMVHLRESKRSEFEAHDLPQSISEVWKAKDECVCGHCECLWR
jgi:hypothetical protein